MRQINIKITIGKYVFNYVNSVNIVSSRTSLIDTASIILPAKYKRNKLNDVIQVGDDVEIKLGYDDKLKPEFKGYVSELLPRVPFAIKCEDEMFKLKRSPIKAKSWKKTTLKSVLNYIVPNANVDVPNINMEPFYIDKTVKNKAQALQMIKDSYGLDIYYRNGILYAGLAYSEKSKINKPAIIYHLQKNVIRNDLRYRRAEDVKLRIKAVSLMPNNEQITVLVGDTDGELRTEHFYNKTVTELNTLANEKLKEYKYNGYSGSIKTFGLPYLEHCDIVKIYDEDLGNKGKYFVDEVTTSSGVSGFRRTVKIGRKA